MKTAIIPISETSREITDKLVLALHAKVIKRRSVGRLWKHYDAFVFIGAMGICVRTIAPYIKDKHTYPAVVCYGHSTPSPTTMAGKRCRSDSTT